VGSRNRGQQSESGVAVSSVSFLDRAHAGTLRRAARMGWAQSVVTPLVPL
jgi:hypothetical protein